MGPGVGSHHRNATAANLAVLILNDVAGKVGTTVHIDAADAAASAGASSGYSGIDALASFFNVAPHVHYNVSIAGVLIDPFAVGAGRNGNRGRAAGVSLPHAEGVPTRFAVAGGREPGRRIKVE